MLLHTLSGVSIALLADAGSALADGVGAVLSDLECEVLRYQTGQKPTVRSEAGVFVIQNAAAVEALRQGVEASSMPTLVLAATRQLAEAVVPMLDERHALGTIGDTPGVFAWRLRHLLALARRQSTVSTDVDALTGLLNRRAFEARLALASMTSDQSTGLLLLDLDHFKLVNDRLGHAAGDQVLHAVACMLSRSLRPDDAIARLGGDEFACLITRGNADEVVAEAERLLAEMPKYDIPRFLKEPTLRFCASAGLTFVRPEVGKDVLLMEADVAMYEAKCNCRGQLSVYERCDDVGASRPDLRVEHFENSARLATERLVEMITLKGRRLIDAARREADVCWLTGLYNRRYLDAQLTRELERARDQGSLLSLMMVDLDKFSDINRQHGWPTGDRVLKAFASIARSFVRSTDWVARYGGEEFVIVMPGTDVGSAQRMADRIRQVFAMTSVESVEGEVFSATLSASVVEWSDGIRTSTDLLQRASRALLQAKKAGRNRVEPAGPVAREAS
jgi:two-component system cell cycle response regulator